MPFKSVLEGKSSRPQLRGDRTLTISPDFDLQGSSYERACSCGSTSRKARLMSRYSCASATYQSEKDNTKSLTLILLLSSFFHKWEDWRPTKECRSMHDHQGGQRQAFKKQHLAKKSGSLPQVRLLYIHLLSCSQLSQLSSSLGKEDTFPLKLPDQNPNSGSIPKKIGA